MNTQKNLIPILLLFGLLSSLSGCQLIADIFKGGMYFGILLVIVVVVIVIWLLRKISSR